MMLVVKVGCVVKTRPTFLLKMAVGFMAALYIFSSSNSFDGVSFSL